MFAIYIKTAYNMGKRTWTDDELKILQENFPDGGIYKCMELLPNKKRDQIKAKIDALGIKSNHYDKWTEEENKKLKEAWETYSMEELLSAFPGRTYQKIQLHANWLGYTSKINRNKKCDLSFLDIDNLSKENSYWWGFIMADGHISKKNELIIQLKDIDKEHLDKLCNKISASISNKPKGFVRMSASDITLMKKWREILELKDSAKTYFPPNLRIFENTLVYFFIGFVDGDGCIWFHNNYPQLKIETHCSWKENLEWVAEVLRTKYGIESAVVKISKKGTVVLSIGRRRDIISLLEFVKEVDYMQRKWEKIFEYEPTRHDNNF